MSTTPFSTALLSTPLVYALNHVLDQAGWARQKLQPFAGRNVRIAMAPFSIVFAIDGDGRLQRSAAAADLDIVLPADAPLRALDGGEQAMKAAAISGPADLAEALGAVLQHLRWDIEADLARVFGDIAAHRMARGLESFAAWQKQSVRNLAENVGEYLVEETSTLVRPTEIQRLADDIRDLGERIERLENRLR